MKRTPISSLDLPPGSDARALAESLVGAFGVTSISGSGGEHEVRFANPAELVAVIGPSRASFFLQEEDAREGDDDAEPAEDHDPEEEDPYDFAEAVSDHLAARLGLLADEDEEGDAEDEEPPDDDHDRVAREVVAALLERGLMELSTPRSRSMVEGRVARCLSRGKVDGEAICAELTKVDAVSEIYASDEELSQIVRASRRPRAPRPR